MTGFSNHAGTLLHIQCRPPVQASDSTFVVDQIWMIQVVYYLLSMDPNLAYMIQS